MSGGLGALTPPGMGWVEGKTAGAIAFISEAEALLAQNLVPEQYVKALEAEVESLKSGAQVSPRYEDPDAWLWAQINPKRDRGPSFKSNGEASVAFNTSFLLG